MVDGRMGNLAITNARIVTPADVIERGYVVVEDGRIVDVGSGEPRGAGTRSIDVGRRTVLPGLVDLHGDDVERHLAPRSGARVDTRTALLTCDRANVAAGITTKFHALAFEESPGENRSIEAARDVLRTVASMERLLADHRIHARCEVSDGRCVAAAVDALPEVDLLSIMNHVPGRGQFDDVDQFASRYADEGPDGSVERIVARREAVPPGAIAERIDRLVRSARSAGVVVLSHDDERPSTVERLFERGVAVSEFPTTMAAARRATDLGMTTTMGAPNLVRGGSLWGNLDAGTAIEAGVVDVLCSDFHPHSLLESVFVDTGEALPDRVRRVTEAPARAAGLDDRGRVAPGARADLVVLEPGSPPTVTRTFVAGEEVFRIDHRGGEHTG